VNYNIGGILLTILLISSQANAQSKPNVHWGVAKNDAGNIIYTERHSITSLNDVLKNSETLYFDSLRKNKIGILTSDYSRSLAMPTYEFRDLRTGYREGLRFSNGKYVVYFKKPNQEEKADELSDGKSIFSCQGWHYYLIENLNLLEKQDIALNLVLPSELDFYSFKVKQSNSTGKQIVANLELSNWLLGFFAPKLRLTYDKQLKKLVEYKGVSNILDDNGDRQDVTIHYEYDELIKGKK